ncbi:glycosyltransferase family 2 protein [uncultured Shimia sp.]|uniref:glycosyltransferase family 2 protein n=1 Tax=uncultured Shimia sp. TaxID=573152 RepID=UPI0026085AEB|nr:glycosyltransferase family 2 protein [uncultured Shimia sp.]
MSKSKQNKGGQGKGKAKPKSVVSKIYGTVDFPVKPNVSPHGRVTAVSMMKDEGPFVLEWVAHHLALGFTDLIVFTNDCSDGTDDMLIRLEELGLAHHRRNDIPEGIRPQPSALKHAQVDPLVCDSDWLLVFDADEFLCIRHGDGSLDGMISAAEEVGANGIVITWRIFGSGGVHDWSRDPVTEQYLQAAPPMWNKGWGVKTLFKFDPEYWKLGIHRPKIKNKHLETGFPDQVQWLNGSGRPMEDYFKFRGWRSIVRTVGYDWAQLNHYAVKSIESYAIRKFRGNVNLKKDKYNSDYWALQDRNEVHDASILRHSERRNEILEQLLTDPVLNDLHFKAVEKAEARLAEFKATPAYDELVAGLKKASEVPIAEVDAKPPKPRDAAKIAALMSEVEKKVNQKSKGERAERVQPDWTTAGDLYVNGTIDISGDTPLQYFENQKLKVPADPRVFTPGTLQRVVDGKYERNIARGLARMVPQGATFVEVGAGVGFLPAVVKTQIPSAQVIAQEENTALASVAESIWAMNSIEPSDIQHSKDPLVQTQDSPNEASGLTDLLVEASSNVLVVSDPSINATMLATAVQKTAPNLPKVILITARALNGQIKQNVIEPLLVEQGYKLEAEAPFISAVMYRLA